MVWTFVKTTFVTIGNAICIKDTTNLYSCLTAQIRTKIFWATWDHNNIIQSLDEIIKRYSINTCAHVIFQETAYEEIYSIFGDSDRAPTYGDLKEMKFLNKVILESMRRFPTVQFVARQIKKDMELKSNLYIKSYE